MITIQTDYDFTPAGKRAVRVVRTNRGTAIRGYVSGRRYMRFATMQDAIEWRDNTEKLAPQPWGS